MTGHRTTNEYGYLLFSLMPSNDNDKESLLRFDIPFKLSPCDCPRNFFKMLGFALVVAAVGIKPEETTLAGLAGAYALRALAALAAALLVFYGIKRPF